jgi:hypothetical protein
MTSLYTHLRLTEADSFLMTVVLLHRGDSFNNEIVTHKYQGLCNS